MTDEECLNNIRHGGSARTTGIAELYRSHARKLLSYFLKHRVVHEQAEDLLQEVFINVVRHCGNFRGESRIDAWMWSIARNCLMDHFRRQRPEVALDEDDLIAVADSIADPPVEQSAGPEDCVRKAYAEFALAYRDRAAVLARVAFDEWSIDDVAAMLKRSNGATREYLSQCRKKLKAFLEPCREFLET